MFLWKLCIFAKQIICFSWVDTKKSIKSIVDYHISGYGKIPKDDLKKFLIKAFEEMKEESIIRNKDYLRQPITAKYLLGKTTAYFKTKEKQSKYEKYAIIGCIMWELGLIKYKNYKKLDKIPKNTLYNKVYKYLNYTPKD